MRRIVVISVLGILCMLLTGVQVQHAAAQQAGPVVTMGATTFGQTNITIKQGQSITFVDEKATGTEHILVLGRQGMAQPEAGAPTFKGSTGIVVQPGQQWTSAPWNHPGTYHVTCTIHPTTMNLTVTVKET